MIKNASNQGLLRLTISPSNIKPLSKSSTNSKAKSLPSLNDERIYHDGTTTDGYNTNAWSPYDGSFSGHIQSGAPPASSSMVKYMSTSRIDHAGVSPHTYQDRPYSSQGFDTYKSQALRPSAFLTSQPYLPTDPWPRKNISLFICRHS
jgi:hypothetical protein